MTKRIYPHPHDRLGAGTNTDPKISLMRLASSQGIANTISQAI